jgi:hypothetical protein
MMAMVTISSHVTLSHCPNEGFVDMFITNGVLVLRRPPPRLRLNKPRLSPAEAGPSRGAFSLRLKGPISVRIWFWRSEVKKRKAKKVGENAIQQGMGKMKLAQQLYDGIVLFCSLADVYHNRAGTAGLAYNCATTMKRGVGGSIG